MISNTSRRKRRPVVLCAEGFEIHPGASYRLVQRNVKGLRYLRVPSEKLFLPEFAFLFLESQNISDIYTTEDLRLAAIFNGKKIRRNSAVVANFVPWCVKIGN
jgi:hypothetical protein